MLITVTPFLSFVRECFVEEGFDIRFVGGCVRDSLSGTLPKDIDLCTDANPLAQSAIYQKRSIRAIETGLKHGTITIVDPGTGETYEVTSLRIDTDHDGRHATVEFTNDWDSDLARRDFTFNAMMMTFDGTLYDPFGGAIDLRKGIVRFVGSAEERIKEDYLRILRYFRFLGRYGSVIPVETSVAIRMLAPGLKKISVERVWSEVSKIIVGPSADAVLVQMRKTGVTKVIGMIPLVTMNIESTNPITRLVACQGDHAITLTHDWKMSAAEQNLAKYLVQTTLHPDNPYLYELAVKRVYRDWVVELARLRGDDDMIQDITTWDIPKFPLSGHDLSAEGIQPGPRLGQMMSQLKDIWAASGYLLDRKDLLAEIVTCTELNSPDRDKDRGSVVSSENPPEDAATIGRIKGGFARAKALSPEARSSIAKKAAATRWGHSGPKVEATPDSTKPLPKEVWSGALAVDQQAVSVYLLDNGDRVISFASAHSLIFATNVVKDDKEMERFGGLLGVPCVTFSLRDDLKLIGISIRHFVDLCETILKTTDGDGQFLVGNKSIWVDISKTISFLSFAARFGLNAMIEDHDSGWPGETIQSWYAHFPKEVWDLCERMTGWKADDHGVPRSWSMLIYKLIVKTFDDGLFAIVSENMAPLRDATEQVRVVKAIVSRCYEIVGMSIGCQDIHELEVKVARHLGSKS